MLKKFVRIKNVGRFTNHKAVGQAFRGINVIWGPNSAGKTTLAAIVDSLRSDEPGIVAGRTTIGAAEPAEVELLTNDGLRKYANNQWDAQYEHVEVYYSGFVSRTVLVGDEVTVDNKRALSDFALGREAVALKRREKELLLEEKSLETETRQTKKTLEGCIQGALSLGDFIALPNQDDIDERIAAKKRDLDQARDALRILAAPVPQAIPIPPPLGNELQDALAMSLAEVDQAAVDRLHRQISEHLDEHGEAWLRYGTKALAEDELCPYCGQEVSGVELVDAYRQYFGEEYARFVASLETSLDALEARLQLSAFDTAAMRIEHARGQALAYSEYCVVDKDALVRPFDELRDRWNRACDVLAAAMDEKRQNPLAERALDEAEARALSDVNAVLQSLADAQVDVATAARTIDEYRAKLEAADIPALTGELAMLGNTHSRHSAPISAACETYTNAIARKAAIGREKEDIRAAIDAKMAQHLGSYKDSINYYLGRFGASVSVVDVAGNYVGREANVDYKLAVLDTPIDTTRPGAVPDHPCIANVLGDGDKSALALAFFLARLRAMDSLEGLCVFFDDPVNSMDHTRLTQTVQEVLDLASRGAQVIVSTHNPSFARALLRHPLCVNPLTLRIVRQGASNCLRPWDPNSSLTDEYFANYNSLADFLETGAGDARTLVKLLRPFAEDYIRYRFPGLFTSDAYLGDMLRVIDECEEGSPLAEMRPAYADLDAANTFTAPYMHGTGATRPPELDEAALELHVRKVLEIAGWTEAPAA